MQTDAWSGEKGEQGEQGEKGGDKIVLKRQP